ncbi:MAG: ABC transporter ATP-binding protein [Acidobacteria bacterium]|nr:ABC transporter ATP-binding protein [Acidobacteriota bacterium]MDW7983739.1 ABC transporter ATP-binding protein [Acidobacteriota bacterium]
MTVVLETKSLVRRFGQVVAADGLSVQVREGEQVGIVGPNGAGKTTFLNLVTGYIRPERGTIQFMGRDITGLHPRAIARLGIARTFQIPQLYPNLTVLENMLLAWAAREGRIMDPWWPLRRTAWVEPAMDLLARFGLAEDADWPTYTLPEGKRKLLDVALALALGPRLLLMDEPTSGVSVREKFPLMDTLMETLIPAGVTVLFVEHDMDVVLRYARRVLVFQGGRVVADGDPQAVLTEVPAVPMTGS